MFTCGPAFFYVSAGGGGGGGSFQRITGFSYQWINTTLGGVDELPSEFSPGAVTDQYDSTSMLANLGAIGVSNGSTTYRGAPLVQVNKDGTIVWQRMITRLSSPTAAYNYRATRLVSGDYVIVAFNSSGGAYLVKLDGASGGYGATTRMLLDGSTRQQELVVEVSDGTIIQMGLGRHDGGTGLLNCVLLSRFTSGLTYVNASVLAASPPIRVDLITGANLPPEEGQIWNNTNVWVAMATDPGNISTSNSIKAVLTDTAGNIVTQITYAPSAEHSSTYVNNLTVAKFTKACVLENGDFIFAFQHSAVENSYQMFDPVVCCVSTAGVKRWTKRLAGPFVDNAFNTGYESLNECIFNKDSNGDIYVVSYQYLTAPEYDNYGINVFKLSGTTGTQLWKKLIVGSRVGSPLAQPFSANIVMVGGQEKLAIQVAAELEGVLPEVFTMYMSTQGEVLEANPNEFVEIPNLVTLVDFVEGSSAGAPTVISVDKTANVTTTSAPGTFGDLTNVVGTTVTAPAFTYS